MVDEATSKKVMDHYQKGQGSIQDIARVYRLTVDEVLHIIGQDELLTVTTQGDLVDQSELQPGATLNPGDQFRVPFSLD